MKTRKRKNLRQNELERKLQLAEAENLLWKNIIHSVENELDIPVMEMYCPRMMLSEQKVLK